MSFRSQKVYVIKSPDSTNQNAPDGPVDTGREVIASARSSRPNTGAANQSRPVWMAYAFGPVMSAVWSTGRRAIVWWILGPGSLAAIITLAALWSSFNSWLERVPNGVVVWLTVVAVVVLSIVTAWARAISTVHFARPAGSSRRPKWMSDPRLAAGFGMLVPGLGLMAAGRSIRAACAFWIVGPIAVAALVLINRDWLWERGRSSVTPGISGNALEVALLVAAGVAVAALVAWLVQALDAARLLSSGRSQAAANAASIVLLLSLTVLIATSRPASLARNLHTTSTALRLDGYKIIPLALCETATRLDPVTPVYLADAAELNEAMGMKEAAFDKRYVIERRAQEYLKIIREDAGFGQSALAPTADHRSLDTRDHTRLDKAGTWARISQPID
jgi:hypothetical protein